MPSGVGPATNTESAAAKMKAIREPRTMASARFSDTLARDCTMRTPKPPTRKIPSTETSRNRGSSTGSIVAFE